MTELQQSKPKRKRAIKTTDNQLVANWLLEHRWRHSLDYHTKQMLPGFVNDAVWASIYICAGSNNGKVNVSPKLVFKAIMLMDINTNTVKRLNIFKEPMGNRKAQVICQCARFAIERIAARVQLEDIKGGDMDRVVNYRYDRQYAESYYSGINIPFINDIPPTPRNITELYERGLIDEYKLRLREWTLKYVEEK